MKMMQFVSLINPTDAIHAIDRIIDKRKDAILIHNSSFMTGLYYELSGLCQTENCLTILAALEILKNRGYEISKKDYHTGFSDVCEMTGLMGRWQKLQESPTLICDTRATPTSSATQVTMPTVSNVSVSSLTIYTIN